MKLIRISVCLACAVGIFLSLGSIASSREKIEHPDGKLSKAEMNNTKGGFQTCTGDNCSGTTSDCTQIFVGYKKLTYSGVKSCRFTLNPYASCTADGPVMNCITTTYYTDALCSVLAASTPASPNPTSTTVTTCTH